MDPFFLLIWNTRVNKNLKGIIMLIFTIAILLLAIALLIAMHFFYEAEIKQIKDDSKEAIRKAREEYFHKGWNEGVEDERTMRYGEEDYSDISITQPIAFGVDDGYPTVKWSSSEKKNDQITILLPIVTK
jgi:hypothetical protein